MGKFARHFLIDEQGATAIEYGLIAGLIGIVVLAAMTSVFNSIGAKFNLVSSTVQNAGPSH